LRDSSCVVHSSSAPRQSGFPKNVLIDPVLQLQLPPRHCQLNGSHDGLKVQPEGLTLIIDTAYGYQDW
jgi:hypothetical protein